MALGLGVTSYGVMRYDPLLFNKYQPMYVYKIWNMPQKHWGLGSSEIENMLLIISQCAGVFLRNTLKPSVLSLTECHSHQEPISGALMQGSRFSVPATFVALVGLFGVGSVFVEIRPDTDHLTPIIFRRL